MLNINLKIYLEKLFRVLRHGGAKTSPSVPLSHEYLNNKIIIWLLQKRVNSKNNHVNVEIFNMVTWSTWPSIVFLLSFGLRLG